MTDTTQDDLVKRLPQMTDEELIASLRMIHEWKIGFVAADRIEALARNFANTQADFTEQLGRATAYELRMIDAETYVEELEAKLAKAVEALKFYGNEDHYSGEHIPDECGCCGSWYGPKIHKDGEDSGDLARATLAELKGGKDE